MTPHITLTYCSMAVFVKTFIKIYMVKPWTRVLVIIDSIRWEGKTSIITTRPLLLKKIMQNNIEINNYILMKLRNVITHPYSDFNGWLADRDPALKSWHGLIIACHIKL